jgi:Tol biopolymer transport system component
VDATDISVDGNAVGYNAGPSLKHYLVLVAKGSHLVLYIDGQPGPKFDTMIWTGGTPFNSNGNWAGIIPALFTPDGEHFAYCYKDGTQTVIDLDGKEFARIPNTESGGLQMPLTFSKNGKYLAWAQDNTIYINGKPGPQGRYLPQLIFSPDGSRYAYTGTVVGGKDLWAVVDGQQVKYFGDINQFSPNNHLISVYHDDASNTSILVIDGKPILRTFAIRNVWTSPDGKQIGFLIQPDQASGKTIVNIDGKNVPDAEGAYIAGIYWSPDGKRYALDCNANGGGNFMIIDGKKQDTYANIPQLLNLDQGNFSWAIGLGQIEATKALPHTPAFTADSSKFVYLATSNGKNFLMTEDGEYDDYTITYQKLVVASAGSHYGFVGTNHANKEAIVIDGKPAFTTQLASATGQHAIQDFIFSPDGSHYAFLGEDGYLYEDGKKFPGGLSGQNFVFSPDGNHLAYVSYRSGMAIDGKIIADPGPGHSVMMPIWSQNGQHFYFITTGTTPNSKDTHQLYCDGKLVTHFMDVNTAGDFVYGISPQGVLTFITRTDGTLTKFVITPDSDIDAILATAKPAPATF